MRRRAGARRIRGAGRARLGRGRAPGARCGERDARRRGRPSARLPRRLPLRPGAGDRADPGRGRSAWVRAGGDVHRAGRADARPPVAARRRGRVGDRLLVRRQRRRRVPDRPRPRLLLRQARQRDVREGRDRARCARAAAAGMELGRAAGVRPGGCGRGAVRRGRGIGRGRHVGGVARGRPVALAAGSEGVAVRGWRASSTRAPPAARASSSPSTRRSRSTATRRWP